jgi:hypothetical protein
LGLEGDQPIYLVVHSTDDENAEQAHQEEQQGDSQETTEQLGMNGGGHPRHPID